MPFKNADDKRTYHRNYYSRNKARLDKYKQRWVDKNRARDNGYKFKWRKNNLAWFYEWERARNPIIRKAYIAVRNALKSGKLKRMSCMVCGAKKSHAHHSDYHKPLLIEWLCPKHHKERHKKCKI